MDHIAAAAGVGKGTLFRAFRSRDGLLDALWTGKLAALREAVEEGTEPLGPGTPSRERIVAFLDALLSFKLANRHLIRMRPKSPVGVRQATSYKWSHGLLRALIDDAAPWATADDSGYAAHVLLAALDIDLLEELLGSGRAPEDIRRSQAALALAIIDGAQAGGWGGRADV
ncbi:hypothetical protein GCM10023147_27120 [Tsukamurella soli]|uniref:HTH tetR-type domain-containing protein n=1 Tax=Tsukamurella soli TaxID=644556 RepID=A0ABP8JQW1_9ACTN